MPTEIMPWLFEQHHLVRTIEKDGDPWFVAPDVCGTLGLSNTTVALKKLDPDEKGLSFIETPGGRQELNIISEPGLYKLVSRSNKPIAKRFDRWVRHDVLPAIRKTGRYEASPTVDHAHRSRPFPEWTLEEMRTKGAMVDRCRLTFGTGAARWFWPRVGFPEPPIDVVDPLPPRQFTLDLSPNTEPH